MINKKLLFTIFVLLLIIACLLAYKFMSPVMVEGVVDHKAVMGVKGDTSYTILLNRPTDNGSWIIVKDKDYEKFFKGEKNAFISKSIEDEMRKKYFDIKYLVSIRLDSKDPINGIDKGEALTYFVSREIFNKMKIGDRVKFEVSRSEKCMIKRLIQIEKIYPKTVGHTDDEAQKLVEISKQHPSVKKYLEIHHNATCDIRRVYLASDGMVYQVDKHWKIKDFGSVASIGGKPVDGKDHYCWVVHWYDPTPEVGIDHIVDVYIDRDSYDIVFVQEAW